MSQEKVCLFDNSKECPVRKASRRTNFVILVEKACPICPIRLKMIEGKAGKAGFGEM